MSILKFTRQCILVGVVLLLISCNTLTERAGFKPDPRLNVSMKLKAPMLLAETKAWLQFDQSRYWLLAFPSRTYYNKFIAANVPSMYEFKSQQQFWLRWQGNPFLNRARIIGILDEGTLYHIVDIAPARDSDNTWVTIEVDSGIYRGYTALYPSLKGKI